MLSVPLRALMLAGATVAATGCVARGMFTDGTSVSLGAAYRGALRGGKALPPAGDGYVVPHLWQSRGALYGTDEMVSAIERAAERVAKEEPGGTLGVGDLSHAGGGEMPYHKSHESGRDADLIFYAVDASGQPVAPPDAMPRYDRRLRSQAPFEAPAEPISHRIFDLPRNWALVRALVSDETIDIEYLFVSQQLEDRLIDYARSIGEPEALVRRAAFVLRPPGGRRVLPHDDHLHLRIRCAVSDRSQGCVDEGRVRLRSEVYRAESPRPRVARHMVRVGKRRRARAAT